MTKKMKAPTYQFGIEITKPHSKEMYTHNDKIAEEMKANILTAWVEELTPHQLSDEWDGNTDTKLLKIQKNVMYSGYGDGYTNLDVNDEFKSELETMSNWQLHEVYGYCCFDSLVPKLKQGMVGFDWEKMNYWTDDIIEVGCSLEQDLEWHNETSF